MVQDHRQPFHGSAPALAVTITGGLPHPTSFASASRKEKKKEEKRKERKKGL